MAKTVKKTPKKTTVKPDPSLVVSKKTICDHASVVTEPEIKRCEEAPQPEPRPASEPQPAAPPPNPLQAINDFLNGDAIKSQFEAILGAKTPAFILSVMQLITKQPKLHNADLKSIYYAAEAAMQLGLPLNYNLQLCYISPLVDEVTGITYAQFQIGWRGIVQLCLRSDMFEKINVSDVREGEFKGEDKLTGDCSFEWMEEGAERDALPRAGYVAYFKLLNGFNKMIYWPTAKVVEHGQKYSKTFSDVNSGWQTNFPAMAKKTVLREILTKWAPMSVDMAKAMQLDQAVITGKEKIQYMDNPIPDTISEEDRQAMEIQKREDQVRKSEEQLQRSLSGK